VPPVVVVPAPLGWHTSLSGLQVRFMQHCTAAHDTPRPEHAAPLVVAPELVPVVPPVVVPLAEPLLLPQAKSAAVASAQQIPKVVFMSLLRRSMRGIHVHSKRTPVQTHDNSKVRTSPPHSWQEFCCSFSALSAALCTG
jgi:hypothetical protein